MTNSSKSQIEFIYLDVGGVAILDFSKTNKWEEMLVDLGISEAIRSQFNELFDAHEKKICVGEDTSIFVEEAREELGIRFPNGYDMTTDFVNRFQRNEPMLKLLERIKNDFNLGLLTGQYPRMLDMIFDKGLLPKDIWDVVIDSSIEGVTKPDPEIYLRAEERAAVSPESILFVDNKAKLLEYPETRGWQVFEYDTANTEEETRRLENFIYSHY